MIKKYSKKTKTKTKTKTKIHRNIKGGGRQSINQTPLTINTHHTNTINPDNKPNDILSLFNPPIKSWRSQQNVDEVTLQNIDFIEDIIKTMSGFNSNINIKEYIRKLFKSDAFFQTLVKINYEEGLKNKDNLPIIDETNIKVVLSLHGETIPKFFKLPKNVNIVFLSSIGYYTCVYTNEFIEFLLKNQNLNKFLNNPDCFSKSIFGSFFRQSVIYYGGQYCIETRLSRQSTQSYAAENVSGIYIYDNKKNTFEQNNDLFTKLNIPIEPDLSKDNLKSTLLSSFIETYFNIKHEQIFTIFITSCREYPDNTIYNKYNNTLIFYERIIKSLNFKLHNDKNKTYNKNTLNSYANCKGKITNFTRQSHFTQKIQNQKKNKTKIIKSSNSIIIADDSKIMLNNLNNNNLNYFSNYINTNNNNDNNKFIYIKKIKKIINENILNKKNIFAFIINMSKYIINFGIIDDIDNDYYPELLNYYNFIIFIFDNNYQLSLEYLFYLINYLFDYDYDKNKIIKFLTMFIDKYKESFNFTELDLSSFILNDELINKMPDIINELQNLTTIYFNPKNEEKLKTDTQIRPLLRPRLTSTHRPLPTPIPTPRQRPANPTPTPTPRRTLIST